MSGDFNMDHADLLEASGKFDHEDYQRWLDEVFEQTQAEEDRWWSARAEMEGEF